MTLTWNGDAAMKAAQEALAKRMLAAAVLFQSELRKRLNVSNPRPYRDSSRQGEYPRARSGFGRDSVSYEPADARGVIDAGFVIRLGYRQNAFYMAVQEIRNKRLGLQRTWEDLLPEIRKVIEGK